MAVSGGGPARVVKFAWPDSREQVLDFAARFPAASAAANGRAFVAADAGARLVLPFLLPPPLPGENPGAYAERLPERLGRQCVLLLQAGATALGWWDEDELVAHKAMKRYVVRGHGKAQPTHAKTKGKSRYGARLRLQNWRRLLGEVNERLCDWWREHGAPEQVLWAVPVRSWPELFEAAPPPPFERDDGRLRRIPRHVHVPDFRELLRIRALAARGRLELPE